MSRCPAFGDPQCPGSPAFFAPQRGPGAPGGSPTLRERVASTLSLDLCTSGAASLSWASGRQVARDTFRKEFFPVAQGFCVSSFFLVLYDDVCAVYTPERGKCLCAPSLPIHHLTIYSPVSLLTPFLYRTLPSPVTGCVTKRGRGDAPGYLDTLDVQPY